MAFEVRWYISNKTGSGDTPDDPIRPTLIEFPTDSIQMATNVIGLISKPKFLVKVWADTADHATLAGRSGVTQIPNSDESKLISTLNTPTRNAILAEMQALDENVTEIPAGWSIGDLIDWYGNTAEGNGGFDRTKPGAHWGT